MNRFKRNIMLILLGLLAVCCIVTAVIRHTEEKKEEIKNSDKTILEIDPDTVTKLSWSYDDVSLGFSKGESWKYDDDEAFTVDDDKMASLLELFRELGATFEITEVEDYEQYGLNDPVCTIKIAAADKDVEIKLGAYSAMDEERYISIGDGEVYLISHDLMDDFELELKDMLKDDKVPYITEAVSIAAAGSLIDSIAINYDDTEGKSVCTDDMYYTDEKPLSTSRVSSYLASVSNLMLQDYVSYNATDEELTKYGLNDPELTLDITYKEEEEEDEDGDGISSDLDETAETEKSFSLSLGRNQDELKEYEDYISKHPETEEEETAEAEESAEDEVPKVTAYARVGDSKIIYQITEDEYNSLMAMTYDELRHKNIMTASDDDITGIDITLDGNEYKFTSKPGEKSDDEEDADRVWYYDSDKEISTSSVLAAITALNADSFTNEAAGGKEEISLKIYIDNENFPEIDMTLYRYDGTDCIAVLNGETVACVTRAQTVDLIEAVNAIVLN